jgi:hypothetical protein
MIYKINLDRLKSQRLKNCPCELEQIEDNKCPCVLFTETGKCKCGVFKIMR